MSKPDSLNEPLPRTHVQVALGQHAYQVTIGPRAMVEAGQIAKTALKATRAFIVTDEQVASRYLHRVSGALAAADIRASSFILPAGEPSKNAEQLMSLTDDMLKQAPDRATAVIALGGGVVGDIAGCAASLVLRGLPLLQIPTTLLAQVDSSVGGKTGVNTSYGKNTLGTFYQPKHVLIDTSTLETLPKREQLAGYAEIVKYGMINNADFFAWLEQNATVLLAGDSALLSEAIRISVESKAAIVSADEFETKGLRALLNFGHTFGHALEAETGFSQTLLHGEAVAIGMVLACNLSAALGRVDAEIATRLKHHLASVGLRTNMRDIQPNWNVQALLQHMAHDKKAEYNRMNFVLLNRLGEAELVKHVDRAIVERVLKEALA